MPKTLDDLRDAGQVLIDSIVLRDWRLQIWIENVGNEEPSAAFREHNTKGTMAKLCRLTESIARDGYRHDDTDPIELLRDEDGELLLIRGRHRFAVLVAMGQPIPGIIREHPKWLRPESS